MKSRSLMNCVARFNELGSFLAHEQSCKSTTVWQLAEGSLGALGVDLQLLSKSDSNRESSEG